MVRLRRRARLVMLGAALAFPLAVLLAAHVAVGRESARIYRDLAQVPTRPVAIVPGALVYGDTPSPVLEDRLAAALELYRAGTVERILVSGDHGRPDYDEVNVMRAWLVARGVPSADVFMDHAGLRTLDTMARASRVFGVSGAVVCTQAFHLPRALFLARHAGLDAVGYVADRRIYTSATADAARERLAVPLALVDVLVGRGPRFLGAPVPIDGDARRSHDAATRP